MPSLTIPHLESERLQLRPLSVDHSSAMFALWSEPAVCEHAGPAVDAAGRAIELPARSREDSDRLLQYWLDRARSGSGLRWAVVHHDTGEFVGAVGFNALGAVSEYAYHFVPGFWGHGFATEASRPALGWAFDRGGEAIECFVEPANVASIRLLERLGFRECGGAKLRPTRFELARAESAGA